MQLSSLEKLRNTRYATLAFFVVLFSIGALLALTQPPYGVSDEPSHTIKALATARFDLSGPEVVGQFGYPSQVFEVPLAYSSIWHMVCYSSNTNVTPDCAPDFSSDNDIVDAPSTAGPYPPIYYGIIGHFGWADPGYGGLVAMRIVSVLLWVVPASIAFSRLRRLTGDALAVAAIFGACTPMMIAIGATVNPFAFEVGLYLLLWTFFLDWSVNSLKEFSSKFDQAVVWLAALLVSGVRPASFLWTGFLLVVSLGLRVANSPRPSKQFALRVRKDFKTLFPLVLSCAISFTLWARQASAGSFGSSGQGLGSLSANLRYSLGRLDDYFLQAYGFFGWTEFYAPTISTHLWFAGLVGLATAIRPNRTSLLIVITWAVWLYLSPLILEGLRASSAGFGYQGRYILPMAVGLPAALALLRRSRNPKGRGHDWVFATLVLGALFSTVVHICRRYVVGLDGELLWWRSPRWIPFGGVTLHLVLISFGIISAAWLILLSRTSRSCPPSGS